MDIRSPPSSSLSSLSNIHENWILIPLFFLSSSSPSSSSSSSFFLHVNTYKNLYTLWPMWTWNNIFWENLTQPKCLEHLYSKFLIFFSLYFYTNIDIKTKPLARPYVVRINLLYTFWFNICYPSSNTHTREFFNMRSFQVV